MPVRSIDINKCIGCGTCVESCPMDVFRLDTIAKKRPEVSPCSDDCPLGLNQREYHNLIKIRMLDEAAALLRERHPMPAITGRVCPHPCETECSRFQVDEAININGLEQYLGDYLLDQEPLLPDNQNGEKIAVIGSGPAGLSAAYFLTLSGHRVTVIEKDKKPGGILRYFVPSFRLSEDILDRQIDIYKKMGIDFKTDVMFGKDISIEELEKRGFKAFIVATGASKPLGISVPGAEAEGIFSAMSFLKDVKLGQLKRKITKVAVIGGGSVALDTARTTIRLGANEVHVICLETLEPGTKDSMRALASEIEETREEGVIIHDSLGVDSFMTSEGHVTTVSCVKCLSVRDTDGRFAPQYGGLVTRSIQADTVITAIGQTADSTLIPADLRQNEQGYIIADTQTFQVDERLFAAGDAVTGPSTVVEALASGKRAALIINRFLLGEDLAAGLDEQLIRADGPPEGRKIYLAPRMTRHRIDAGERIGGYAETRTPLTDRQVQMEVDRCLTCGSRSKIAYMDDCQVCRLCAHYCPTNAIEITDGALMSSLHLFNVAKLGKAIRD